MPRRAVSPAQFSSRLAPVSAETRFPGGAITSDPHEVDRLAMNMGARFPARTIVRHSGPPEKVGDGSLGPGNPVRPRSASSLI